MKVYNETAIPDANTHLLHAYAYSPKLLKLVCMHVCKCVCLRIYVYMYVHVQKSFLYLVSSFL